MPPKKATAAKGNGASAKKADVVATSNGSPRTAPRASSTTQPSRTTRPAPTPNSPRFLVALAAFFITVASTALFFHYRLPAPISSLQTAASEAAGRGALFCEENVHNLINKLSVEIGYRIVGTSQHVRAEEWLLEELRKYEGTHNLGPQAGNVEVEVWQQTGNGAHRFDFLDSTVYKKYYGMSNVIVRISDGTEASKANSILVNAHLDSTLPSPGAADDGVGVGIMMELVRILTTPGANRKPLRHSAILLFNNGEESFQDASHLYITSNHSTVPSVKSVVNLEACGVSGPELVFQASNPEMIRAYRHAPHPFATVLANDVFSSGIVLSDTDYRQFMEYGKIKGGLDMAIVGNSYLYHTRKDIPQYIDRGVVQHFGENVLGIVEYLITDPTSQLSSIAFTPKYEAPIYFSLLGSLFINLPAKIFRGLSMGMSAFTNFQLQSSVKADKHFGALKATTLSILGAFGSLVAALVASNAAALIMTQGLRKPLSWFSHEWLPVPLYAPPAIAAILAVQLGISKLIKREHQPYLERASLNGLILLFLAGLIGLNAFAIGSAYLCALGALTLLVAITINDFALVGWGEIELKRVAVNKRVHPATYFVLAITPAVVGTEGLTSFLDLFVPLMGRTGDISPADHILASIVAALSFLSLPMLVPLAHRFGRPALRRAIMAAVTTSVIAMAIYASPTVKPFDEMHPQRLFVHQVHNVTSGQWWMNLGSADPSPPSIFAGLAAGLQEQLGMPGGVAELQEMNERNPDFDILYPVSAFITPYKFRLPDPAAGSKEVTRWNSGSSSSSSSSFVVRAVDETLDLTTGTRRVTLHVDHPRIIWSVLAFDGEILEWDLPVTPPAGYRRHHIKEVSRFGQDTWSVSLLLKLQPEQLEAAKARADKRDGMVSMADHEELVRVDPQNEADTVASHHVRDQSRLRIDYSGLWGEAMYPQAEKSDDVEVLQSKGVETFRKMDGWLQREHPEVDAMLLNVIAGVAIV